MAQSLVAEIWQSIKAIRKAHRFLVRKENLKLFLPPLLMNLVFWLALGSLLFHYAQKAAHVLLDVVGVMPEEGGGWLSALLSIIFLWLIRTVVVFMFLLVYKYLITLIMSPYLSFIVKRVYRTEGFNSAMPISKNFFKPFLRFTVVNVKIFIIELSMLFLFGFLFVIPPVAISIPVITFIIGAYFLGFAVFDIALEKAGYDRGSAEKWISNRKLSALLIGSVFYLIVLIPGLVVILPFGFLHTLVQVYLLIPVFAFSIAPLYAVVAAAYVVIEEEDLKF